jgi:predicted transcriptional regulator
MDEPMPKVTSIRLSEELVSRLDQLAGALDRPRSWLIEQAIARYLDEEAWQVAAVAEAVAEYREGGAKLTPHHQVMKELREHVRAGLGDADPLA